MIKKILWTFTVVVAVFLCVIPNSFAFPIFPEAPQNTPIAPIFIEIAGETTLSPDFLPIDASPYLESGQSIGLDIYLNLDSFTSGLAGCNWLFLYDSDVFSLVPDSANDGDLFSWPGHPDSSTPGRIEFYSGSLSELTGDIKIGNLELSIDSPMPGSYPLTVSENGIDVFMLDDFTNINNNIQFLGAEINIPSTHSIPEPAGVLLLSSLLIGLIGFKKEFNR